MAVEFGGRSYFKEVEEGGGEVDGRNDVIGIDGVWFGDARDFDDEWSVGGVMPEGGLCEGKGHAVIGEKNNDGVVGFTGFFECIEDGADGVISSSDRGIVEGEFFPDLRVLEEEAGDGDFVGFEGF